MRRFAIATGVTAALAVAGCEGPAQSSSAGVDPAERAMSAAGLCPTPVDRAPSAGECTLVDWNVLGIDGGSVDIEYFVNEPGCSLALDRVDIDETADSVTLRVVVGYAGDGDTSCPTALATRTTTVELATPLGARQLLGCRPTGSFAPAGGYDTPDPRTSTDCRTLS